ncbi:hypothetical protein N7530_006273 [Penicillium desertorum]|uniref:Uncharacterized protein n=1 Tax=Penicillium desertorum TaxID=1303715 RepID=A0A9W9WRC6_9EURO|nr:hypothetical protein N7530_006273 [Penicillium desertorum]
MWVLVSRHYFPIGLAPSGTSLPADSPDWSRSNITTFVIVFNRVRQSILPDHVIVNNVTEENGRPPGQAKAGDALSRLRQTTH